jgi:hypothetical protein
LRVETLPYRLKIFACNLPFEAKKLSAAPMPLAFDSPALVVIIALPEMALSVALTAGHRANRQHSLTLALFEIRDQESCCSWLDAFHVQTAGTSWRGC